MGVLVQCRAGVVIALAAALARIAVATPNKAMETVEIDGKGTQKKTHHETPHDAHEKKEHAVEKEASHSAKDTHEAHDAKKVKEPAHAAVSHATEIKAEEHHKHSSHDSKQVPHKAEKVFSDEEEDDAALDELEAMTIARTFEKKHSPPWGPPAAVPCTWQEWENDGSCAYTCGGRGKTGQKQNRGKNPAKHGGAGCTGKDTKSVECALEDCPTTTTTTEEETTTTTAGGAPRMADLSLTLLASVVLALPLFTWTRH